MKTLEITFQIDVDEKASERVDSIEVLTSYEPPLFIKWFTPRPWWRRHKPRLVNVKEQQKVTK